MPVYNYGIQDGESGDGGGMSLSDGEVHDIKVSDSGSSGQTIARMTIPKAVAEKAEVVPGDTILVRATDEGQIIVEPIEG